MTMIAIPQIGRDWRWLRRRGEWGRRRTRLTGQTTTTTADRFREHYLRRTPSIINALLKITNPIRYYNIIITTITSIWRQRTTMAFGDTEIASTGSVGGRRSQNVLAIVVVVVVGRRHGGYNVCCASHDRSRKNAVDPTPNDRCVCCCSTVLQTASFVVPCTVYQ